MEISDFLTLDRVALDVRVRDKGQLITEIARNFVRSKVAPDPQPIEAALSAREQLGSTGLGSGFALPHARVEQVEVYCGLFIRLAKPIEFDAIDSKPVVLVFAMLIPSAGATQHVAALAAISRRFRDADVVANLRKVRTAATAFEVLTGI